MPVLAYSIHVYAVYADLASWSAANKSVATTYPPDLYIHVPHYVGRISWDMDVICCPNKILTLLHLCLLYA